MEQCKVLQVLILAESNVDGNDLFPALRIKSKDDSLTHLDTLTVIDFTGNIVGDAGAHALANFMAQTRALNVLKLSKCQLAPQHLQKIFHGCLMNTTGLTKEKYDFNNQAVCA